MVAINPQKINGNWLAGYALDFHTVSSAPIGHNETGHMQYDTVRTEIGELLYQLKYRNNLPAAQGIIKAAAEFLRPFLHEFDLIVPVPPSKTRPIQPVLVLANGIGAATGLPVMPSVAITRPSLQLKEITAPEKRKELLDGLHTVNASDTVGKNILLCDDLFRSGATMNAVTDVLLRQGQAASVCALTITRTRSNQ